MPQFYEGKDILTGVIVEAHSLEFFKVAMERKKLLLRVCSSSSRMLRASKPSQSNVAL